MAKRRKCPIDCPCLCHDTGGGVHPHRGEPCPGKMTIHNNATGFDVFAALQRIEDERKPVDCWVGNCPRVLAKPAHTPCCSSHDKPLCCEHYNQLHFVEVGPNPCHTE